MKILLEQQECSEETCRRCLQETAKPYGYGFCAAIPEDTLIPEHLKEMRLPGGVYAIYQSTDDIPGSWKNLMNQLAQEKNYKSDHSRYCLEEHIRNDKGGFIITLYEPVALKHKI